MPFYGIRRSQPWRRPWIVYSGVAAVAISLLSVLLYCTPSQNALSSRRESSILGSQSENVGQKNTSAQTTWSKRRATGLMMMEANVIAAGGLNILRPEFTGLHSVLKEEPAQTKEETLLPGECGGGRCRNGTVRIEDFVFALASHEFNEPALIAGRSGRLGMRTYVSTNYTQSLRPYPSVRSEFWSFYPDDQKLKSFYPGDTRASLIPFLAYRDLGDTFKWLFYGDDDTLFFADAAMKLVKDLDPEMPYFLTDHFWYANWNYGYPWHPHWRAPRCLPCFSNIDTSTLRMGMAKACPCTPWDMCNVTQGYDDVLDNSTCSSPRAPTITYSMHGGAGALISIGLLKRVSLQQMEDCARYEWNSGGDSFITTCLWRAGYGMTDPGPLWHPEGLTRFDPFPRKMIFDTTEYINRRAAFVVGNMISHGAGVCGAQCQNELDHIVSLHFRSRLLTNTSSGAGALLRGVARFYNLQTGRAGAENQQEAASDTEDAAAQHLAAAIDANFTAGISKLKKIVPNLKEVSRQQQQWPLEGAASLFMPSKPAVRSANGKQHVELSLDDLIKGAAAGIAQNILDYAVDETLSLYPPPKRTSKRD